jgi:hypothetical protein
MDKRDETAWDITPIQEYEAKKIPKLSSIKYTLIEAPTHAQTRAPPMARANTNK